MKRSHLHLLIDAGLFAAGVALVATGLLLEWVLPAHSRGDTVWGWTRHDWGRFHFWIALAILALLLAHLALNWAWVCSVAGKLLGGGGKPVRWRRVTAGLAVLLFTVASLAAFLLAADASRHDAPTRGRAQWDANMGRFASPAKHAEPAPAPPV